MKVPAKSTAYLTHYQVGVASNGTLVYERRSTTGTLTGYYNESAGGTIVTDEIDNIEITKNSHIKF